MAENIGFHRLDSECIKEIIFLREPDNSAFAQYISGI